MTEPRTLREHLKAGTLSMDQMVRGLSDGKFDSRRKYSSDELRGLLDQEIGPLSGTTVGYQEALDSFPRDEVQLVSMRLPGKNIYYLTLMIGGKVVLTKDADGQLDLSDPKQGIDHILDEYAAATAGESVQSVKEGKPSPGERKGKGKDKDKDKGDKNKNGKDKPPEPKPTKDKPAFVADPSIEQFFYQYAGPLGCAELESNGDSGGEGKRGGKTFKISGREELEEIVDDSEFLDQADRLNLQLEVQSLTGFLNEKPNRARIRRTQARLKKEIIRDPEVRRAAGTLLQEYVLYDDYVVTFPERRKDLQELCQRIRKATIDPLASVRNSPFEVTYENKGKDMVGIRVPLTISGKRVLEEALEKEDLKFKIKAEEREQKVDRKQIEVRALCEDPNSARYLYRRLIKERDAVQSSRSGEHFITGFRKLALDLINDAVRAGLRIPKEERKRYRQATLKWALYARAGDVTLNDRHVQGGVIPSLTRRRRGVLPQDGIFDVVCRVGRNIINSRRLYGNLHLTTIVRGLSMHGYLEKREGEERTVAGTTQFTDGYRNIRHHGDIYREIILEQAEILAASGKVTVKDISQLRTQIGCQKFGREVYDTLPEERQQQFARIKGEAPLSPSETSPYLNRILGLVVGMYKKEVTQVVKRSVPAK